MDVALLILAGILSILGILGSFLPVIPGPILSFLALACIYWTDQVPANYTALTVAAVAMIIISILDYVIPAQGTKYFGGSKYGIWGTNIGLVIGLIAPIPFGFIVGPFLGALVGELVFNRSEFALAVKSATGSFIGFIASTFMKMLYCCIIAGLYVVLLIQYYF